MTDLKTGDTPDLVRATAEYSAELTSVAIAAKRHWNYPEKWIELWLPVLTISVDYISKHETWMALSIEKPIAFYSLKEDDGLWLDNLWVLPEYMGQGLGRQLFQHALERSRLRNTKALKIEADPHTVEFYEKMGARKVGEHQSEVDGQPRTLPIMEINL